MPITWRNVEGRGDGHWIAGNLLKGASDSFTGALDSLRSIITDRQKLEEGNFNTQRKSNVNAYLGYLQNFGSAEDLQAAQARGDVQNFLKSLGPNIDPEVARGAVDERLDILNRRANADYQRQQIERERTAKPIMEGLLAQLYSGDEAGFRQGMEENREVLGSAGYLDDLARDLDSRQQTLLDRRNNAEDRQHTRELRTLQMDRERETASDAKWDKQMSSIIADAVAANPISSSAAFRQALAQADKAGIPAHISQREIPRVDSEWQTYYELLPSQAEHLNQFSAQEEAKVAGLKQAVQLDLEQARKVYAVDPSSVYGKLDTVTSSDAVKKLDALGWDSKYNSKNLDMAIKEVLDEGDYEEIKAESPVMYAIASEAVARLGEEGDFWQNSWLGGPGNVKIADLKRVLNAELIHYKEYTKNAAALLKLEQDAKDTVLAAEREASRRISEQREAMQSLRDLLPRRNKD